MTFASTIDLFGLFVEGVDVAIFTYDVFRLNRETEDKLRVELAERTREIGFDAERIEVWEKEDRGPSVVIVGAKLTEPANPRANISISDVVDARSLLFWGALLVVLGLLAQAVGTVAG